MPKIFPDRSESAGSESGKRAVIFVGTIFTIGLTVLFFYMLSAEGTESWYAILPGVGAWYFGRKVLNALTNNSK